MRVSGLLIGSWVVISGVISRVTILLTPLITAHEPPSRVQGKPRSLLVGVLRIPNLQNCTQSLARASRKGQLNNYN